MKKFLTTSFILLALAFGTVGVHVPFAQAVEPLLPLPSGLDGGGSVPAITAAPASVDPAAKVDPNAAGIATGLTSDTSEGFGSVMIFIMGLFAWLVGVAAVTLDYAVYYTVIRMGEYVNSLAAIGVSWRILRDIANIMFIFGFIGAGIATILNIEQYGWKTKMLPMLLVGAIFLNFSLFISEALIDTTNLFATQFYKQINGGKLPTLESLDEVSFENEGISNAIMNSLGLQNIYGDIQNTEKAEAILKGGNSWAVGWMGVLLFSIAAFVMFSLAFILIARFVVLIFLIVVSPVAFMGLAIPQMENRAKQWWKHFFDQIITAPVLLLLLYVALAVITDAQFLSGFSQHPDWLGLFDSTNGSLVAGVGGFAGMMLSFLVAMGLLLVVVIKAKSMSAAGAASATKLASKLSGVGVLSAGLANGSRLIARSTLGKLGNTKTAKALGMGGLATASFDFRNSKLAKATQSRTGLNLGQGVSVGYKASLAEKEKSNTKKEATANLKQAEKATKEASVAHSEVQTQRDAAVAEHAKHTSEIERIEKENKERKSDKFSPPSTPEDNVKLAEARKAAVKSKAEIDEANRKLEVLEATLKAKIAAEDKMRDKLGKIEDRAELEEIKKALKEKSSKEVEEKKAEKKEEK